LHGLLLIADSIQNKLQGPHATFVSKKLYAFTTSVLGSKG